MPAVLNEAFTSPFHMYKDLNPHGQLDRQSSSDTESIRNPFWGQQSQQQQNQHISFYPPVYHQESPPPPQYHIEQPPRKPDHDCDRLIAIIMSCQHCRNKLRSIMASDTNQQGGDTEPVQTQAPIQGGALPLPNLNLNLKVNSAISNFLFGIAVIFLVDRIINMIKS